MKTKIKVWYIYTFDEANFISRNEAKEYTSLHLNDYIDLQAAALILGIIPAKDSGAHIISLYSLHMGFIIILHIM